MGVNYGLNKVRFPSPVPVGSKVRPTASADDVEEVPGGLQLTLAGDRRARGRRQAGLHRRAHLPLLRRLIPMAQVNDSRLVHGHRISFVRAGSGPTLVLLHGIGNNCQTWAPVIDRLARDAHRHRSRPARPRDSDKPRGDYSVAAFANGVRDLMSVLDIERAHGGRPLARRRHRAAVRLPVPRALRAARAGQQRRPRARAVRRAARRDAAGRRLVLTALTGVSGPLRAGFQSLDRLGQAAGLRRVRDLARGRGAIFALKDVEARRAFLRTLRGVVDSRGQAVSALDRLYLAHAVPMLVVWGSRDPIVPALHAETVREMVPARAGRGVRGRRALGAPRRPRPFLRRAARLPGDHRGRGARPRELALAAGAGAAGHVGPPSRYQPVPAVEHWDVVVVGGGPAGAACAAAARQAAPAARVLVLDRADFPRDKVCGDGIAPEALDVLAALGLDAGGADGRLPAGRAAPAALARRGDGRAADAPAGRASSRARCSTTGCSPRRSPTGAEFRRHTVRRVEPAPTHVEVDGGPDAGVVVGADGAESVVRRALGIAPNRRTGWRSRSAATRPSRPAMPASSRC